ncbi:hypothetical protein [Halomonas sp. AOP42-D1-22]|uniref:hypothetical protein n=1 Tax=Halomonas sp. AOP42-D1-22 TaxID=3457667 RepID=UPI004034E1B3
MSTTKQPGRPKGSRNAKPSRKAVNGYYGLLRSAADEGDTASAGLLVMNDTLDRHLAGQQREQNRRRLRDADGDVLAHLDATRQHLLFEVDRAGIE